MAQKVATVALVHGAWADGSSWSKVITALHTKGIKAVTAPLPLTSFADDVSALDRALERIEGPVVLAGHAYAGAVIGAIRNAAVQALVYVAALAPAEGQTVADVFYMNPPHPQAPGLAPDDHGLIWLPDEAFPAAFAPNASAEDLAVLRAVQRPISPACITVPVGRPLWREIPSWYLVAEQDRMIVAPTQRFMAERMTAQLRPHPVDHTPSITAPDVVVGVLTEALQGATR
ncbi:MAG TPA: alpha/beta hydrolase [Steroidobacteraceae bacterium]|jgi:pimeloyl-ACP methyl ester carboxylesterase|nr:alpha/beta hydrolase [Steroidobacteraceae bacterium]